MDGLGQMPQLRSRSCRGSGCDGDSRIDVGQKMRWSAGSKFAGGTVGGGRKGVGALILAVPGPGARGWVENGADGEGGTGWLFCRLDPNFASPASPRPLPEDPTLPPAPTPALSNELRGWKPPPRLPRPPSTLGPSLFLFFAYRHAARHVPLPLHFPHLIRPAAIPTRGDEAGPKDKTGSVMGGKTCNAWPPRNIYHKGRIRRADSCRLVQRDASQLRGG